MLTREIILPNAVIAKCHCGTRVKIAWEAEEHPHCGCRMEHLTEGFAVEPDKKIRRMRK